MRCRAGLALMAVAVVAPGSALPNGYHVRYEELLANPRAAIKRIADQAGVPCPGVQSNGTFAIAKGMTKFGRVDPDPVKFKRAQAFFASKAYLAPFSAEAYRTVWQSLDRTFERRVLGYAYAGPGL